MTFLLFFRRLLPTILLAAIGVSHLPAATITWTNSSGLWHDANNWNPKQVPGLGDTAILNNGTTVTVTNDVTVSAVQFTSSGTLNVSGGKLSTATLNWTGGTIRGLVQTSGGVIGYSGYAKTLVAGALVNSGTLVWSDSFYSSADNYNTNNYGVFSNLVSGVINNTADTAINAYYNIGAFYNAGTFNKTGGSGTTTLNGPFYNSGTVNVSSGTLNLNGGSTNSGAFTATTGTTLQFGGGAHTLAGSATISGTGNLLVNNGTVDFNGSFALTGTNFFYGGTANFNGAYALTTPVIISSGGVYFNNPSAVVNLPSLTMNGGGTLGGATPISTATLNWTGGTIRGLVQTAGGVIGYSGYAKTLVAGALVNSGTLVWSDSFYSSADNYNTNNYGVFSNLVSGVINNTADTAINAYYNIGAFYNAGTFNKTGGSGTTTLNGPFYNSGTVNVSSGTLNLNGGSTNSGAFTATTGTTLQFGGGAHTLAGSATISGTGNLLVNNGTVDFNGSFALTGTNFFYGGTANFNGAYALTTPVIISSGGVYFNNPSAVVNLPSLTMNGGGTLGGATPISTATLNWTGGTIRGLVQTAGGVIGYSGYAKTLVAGALVNSGTLVWSDSFYSSADNYNTNNYGVFSNLVSGVINNTADTAINAYYNIGAFYNAGTFNKTGGSGTTTLNGPFYNSGTVNVSSGTLNLNGGSTNSGAFTATTGTTLQFGGGAHTLAGSATISGTGNLLVNNGTVDFNGSFALTGTNFFYGGTANFNGAYALTTPVIISSGGVYFNNPSAVVNLPSLTMNGGGTLGGATPISTATLNWTGGTIRGLVQTAGGVIGYSGYAKTLVAGALVNSGTLVWSDSFYSSADNYNTNNYGVFSNLVSGVINNTADTAINAYYNIGAFYNAGTFNKTGGSGTTTLNGPFYNSGTVNVSSGTVNLNGGSTNSGAFTATTGTTLQFGGGAHTLAGSATISGTGNLLVNNGTVDFNGNSSVITPLTITAGAVYFNNAASGMVNLPSLIMNGSGTLGGPNPVTTTTLSWTGGTIRNVLRTLGGVIGYSGYSKYLVDGALINSGTIIWSDTFYSGTDGYNTNNYGVFSNLVSGIINNTADVAINANYNIGPFYNLGTINKSGGAGTTTLNGPFYQSGVFNIKTGTVNLTGGSTDSGVFTVTNSTTLQFGGGTHTLAGSASINGTGNVLVSAGVVNFKETSSVVTPLTITSGSVYFDNMASGTVNLPSLTMNGSGTLGGTNPVATATLNWTGGTIRGLVQTAGGVIGYSGYGKLLVGGALANSGTLVWADGFYSGTDGYNTNNYGVFSNLVSGVINNTADVAINANYNIGPFYNLGTLNKTGGSGATTLNGPFFNSGTLNIQKGTVNFPTASTFSPNNGVLAFGLSATNSYGRVTMSGTVELNGTLSAIPLAGYVPTIGDRFTLLSATVRTNTFSLLNLGVPGNGLAWQITYSPTSVLLAALPAETNITAHITGSVTDSNGIVVTNITVYAFQNSGTNQLYLSTLTDSSGQYSLGITNGAWRVCLQGAIARGYDNPLPQDVLVTNADQVVNFVLAPYSGLYYNISASNNPVIAGTISGIGNYYSGTTNTLTATATNGYNFLNWTENNVVVGTSNVLTFVADANHNFTANYTEANTFHVVALATSPDGLTTVLGAGTYSNGQTANFIAPTPVLSGTSNYFFQRFTLTNITVSTDAHFAKTFSTFDPTNLQYVAVYSGTRTNPVILLTSPSRSGVIPTNNDFNITFRFDRTMNTNVSPVVVLTNIAPAGLQPVVSGAGTWSSYWQLNDSYTTPAIPFTNGMDGTNFVYVSNAADTNGGSLVPTNVYSFVVDTIIPTLSNLAAVPDVTSALIAWNSDESASTMVEYGLTTTYGFTTYGNAGVNNHSVTLNGLTAFTTYHYRVVSADAAGNTAISADNIFTTLAAPDLLVTNLAVTGNLLSGSTITIGWADTNAGPVATYASWYDQIVVTNLTTGEQLLNTYQYYNAANNGNIAAGSSQYRQFNFTLPEGISGVGNLQITVTADAYDNQYEFNANGTAQLNNRSTIVVSSTIAAYPDLQVAALTITNSQLRSGSVVGINWQDKNSGSGVVSNTFNDRITVVNLTNSQTLVNSLLAYTPSTSGNIASGASVARQFSFTLPDGAAGAGQFQITIATDNQNAIYEFNSSGDAELNNSNSVAVTSALSPYPDLIVTNILSPTLANAGQSVPLVWTDINQGDAPATNSWFDQVFLSDTNLIGGGQLLATFAVTNGLAAGGSLNLTQNVTLPQFVSGAQWIIVKANVSGAFYESITTNNSAIATNSVVVAPTLQLSLSPSTVLENAGDNAVLVSVSRNGSLNNPLPVSLNSTLTNITFPSGVVIPAGLGSTNFYLGVIDNQISGDSVSGTVSATAASFATSTAALNITDNDTAALSLSVSTNQIAEDAGPYAIIGTVTRNANLASPLTVTLASDSPTALLVPANVIIPAGQTSATFGLTPVIDGVLAGTRRVHINASAGGNAPVSATIDVLNTDFVELSLTLASTVVNEGSGNSAVIGTVTRSVVKPSPQNVQLVRGGSALVGVPNIITIPANAASANFNVSVGSDGAVVGTQTATITASPMNLINGAESVGARDRHPSSSGYGWPDLGAELCQFHRSQGQQYLGHDLPQHTADECCDSKFIRLARQSGNAAADRWLCAEPDQRDFQRHRRSGWDANRKS
ncbi:MAG: CARDB domain-containing protein [Limisphaerales bacterium]